MPARRPNWRFPPRWNYATRRDPDIIALEQDGAFRPSPCTDRAREWLAANATASGAARKSWSAGSRPCG
jgi:hypothetical protein